MEKGEENQMRYLLTHTEENVQKSKIISFTSTKLAPGMKKMDNRKTLFP